MPHKFPFAQHEYSNTMPLSLFLQQLSITEPLELVVDNARSPACPVSKPCSSPPRRRRRTLCRHKLAKMNDPQQHTVASESRWEPLIVRQPTDVNEQRQDVHTHHEDMALKLPQRIESCDFSDEAISSIFATAFKVPDAAPTMPRRITTPVHSRRVLRRVFV
ncbi:hypothetical protein MPSEU_000620000 [Mayamaea pseudoterrestris]|nr:hypothetical protein MPSEU_000620000 [Mayamaea pseudoterrestris]